MKQRYKMIIKLLACITLICLTTLFSSMIIVHADTSLAGLSITLEQYYDITRTSSINLMEETLLTIYTKEELTALCHIVEAEVTGLDCKEAKKRVTHVIMNRVDSDGFPNSILKVILQDGQFAPVREGTYYTSTILLETKEAVYEALFEEDTTQGALFFCRYDRMPNWKKAQWNEQRDLLFTDEVGHSFFK